MGEDEFRGAVYGGLNATAFPGGTEYNHHGADETGPLKVDWGKQCPKAWTVAKKRSECIPLEEAVWGTQGFRRLLEIKRKVDPQSRFQCWHCVGMQESVDSE